MGTIEIVAKNKMVKEFTPVVGDIYNPLVTFAVYNYNYGKYLEECLESIAAQTYSNIEIVFSDNASTDESWDIASTFCDKYPGLMTITRNRTNMGPGANLENCMFNVRGEYVVVMCSDDAVKPHFAERCMAAFEKEPKLGFVMVHREIVNDNGELTSEPPFYNQSCVINGEDQAAVYMMAAVNPSVSQVMYHRQRLHSTQLNIGSTASKWYYPRIQDFHLCTKFPMAYINEPLLLNRVHGQNDSTFAERHLLEILGPYVMNIEFAEVAKTLGMDKVYGRLQASVEKLSTLSLRYATRCLLAGDERMARRYFYLSAALHPEITDSEIYQRIDGFWNADEEDKSIIVQALTETENLVTRQMSYDPPDGSVVLW